MPFSRFCSVAAKRESYYYYAFGIVLVAAIIAVYAMISVHRSFDVPSSPSPTGFAISAGDSALSTYAPPWDEQLSGMPVYLRLWMDQQARLAIAVDTSPQISAQYVHKTGFYTQRVNGVRQWVPFTFNEGTVPGTSWIRGAASHLTPPLSNLDPEEYVIVFVCRKYQGGSSFICGGVSPRWTIESYLTPSATCSASEKCNGVCVNLQEDPSNCGSCNIVCAQNGRCDKGVCAGGNPTAPSVPGVPGCTPITCVGRCGAVADGCGGSLDCGSCTTTPSVTPTNPAPGTTTGTTAGTTSGTSTPTTWTTGVMGQYRYVRVETTKDGWISYRELEVYDTNGKKITSASLRASASYDGTWTQPPSIAQPPQNMLDGDPATSWSSGETTAGCTPLNYGTTCVGSLRNAWFVADLGTIVSVGKVRLLTGGVQNAGSVRILLSADGSNYDEKAHFSPPIADRQWLEVPQMQLNLGLAPATVSGSSSAGTYTPPQSDSGTQGPPFYYKYNFTWLQGGVVTSMYDNSSQPLNMYNFASNETAQRLARMYGGSVVEIKYEYGPFVLSQPLYMVNISGNLFNAGLMALSFSNNPAWLADIMMRCEIIRESGGTCLTWDQMVAALNNGGSVYGVTMPCDYLTAQQLKTSNCKWENQTYGVLYANNTVMNATSLGNATSTKPSGSTPTPTTDSCSNSCSVGTSRCDGPYYESCYSFGSGCPQWVAQPYNDKFCQSGSTTPTAPTNAIQCTMSGECNPGEICESGQCVVQNTGTTTNGDTGTTGSTSGGSPSSGTSSGSSSGLQCPAGSYDCGGTCSDLIADDSNCGSCGNSCFPFFYCVYGSCDFLGE
jgi:hypothetical protein